MSGRSWAPTMKEKDPAERCWCARSAQTPLGGEAMDSRTGNVIRIARGCVLLARDHLELFLGLESQRGGTGSPVCEEADRY